MHVVGPPSITLGPASLQLVHSPQLHGLPQLSSHAGEGHRPFDEHGDVQAPPVHALPQLSTQPAPQEPVGMHAAPSEAARLSELDSVMLASCGRWPPSPAASRRSELDSGTLPSRERRPPSPASSASRVGVGTHPAHIPADPSAHIHRTLRDHTHISRSSLILPNGHGGRTVTPFYADLSSTTKRRRRVATAARTSLRPTASPTRSSAAMSSKLAPRIQCASAPHWSAGRCEPANSRS